MERLPKHSLCVHGWLSLGTLSVYAAGMLWTDRYQCMSLLLVKYLVIDETKKVPILL